MEKVPFVIKKDNETWYNMLDIIKILGYKKKLHLHASLLNKNNKKKFYQLLTKNTLKNKYFKYTNVQKNRIFINEVALFYILLSSKKENAIICKNYVFGNLFKLENLNLC
ncbi:ORF MSV226 hypothetical protein [Melanoplus sanguinipes entomopoxvirus]|uniref:Bro-N domain-containing protein n=1 Tax=Melanoplus sanguinipes entomopoxvirus TaxID=83191 RepID=Q9YVL6_MSEPV|nr:ORF MSV226 hypothetical protein [Melanoplus sanguinipes entomopoxvirus]AAC97710.1 ORF MSV226 hypothetical protein [Melanoplus sanguinipes entomopoxvirus 'O']